MRGAAETPQKKKKKVHTAVILNIHQLNIIADTVLESQNYGTCIMSWNTIYILWILPKHKENYLEL